jgi:FlaA1/EpsC-like NDP-sugar epimerase
MGASKRMAELICQAAGEKQGSTVFSMVRFGNVLGSSGSVIPLFRRQLKAGGPITVTHPEITRYFMTIPEASQLVIQAGAMAKGGEVFVLNMGDSVKILDLAVRMVRLNGLIPKIVPLGEWNSSNDSMRHKSKRSDEISIVFSGLRPGEKLYEELLIGGDAKPSAHPLIMLAREEMLDWNDLERLLDELKVVCDSYRVDHICDILIKAKTGYVSNKSALVDHFGILKSSGVSGTAVSIAH